MSVKFAVTGLFSDGGQDFGSHNTHALARKAARNAIGAGAQKAVITVVLERHLETIRKNEESQ